MKEFAEAMELRLLRCSLSPPPPSFNAPPPPPPTPSSPLAQSLPLLIEEIVSSIEKGDYASALSSDATRLVFPFTESWEFQDSMECADQFYSEVKKSVISFLESQSEAWLSVLGSEDDVADCSCRALLFMCIGVAAFLAFTQCNLTGPAEKLPPFPLQFRGSKNDEIMSESGQWEMWARRQLMSSGSDLSGNFSLLQYIVYANILLITTKSLLTEGSKYFLSGTRSISWWLLRLTLFQQRVLDELLSSLYDLLQVLKSETLHHFGNVDNLSGYWSTNLHEGEALSILTMAYLEAGIIEHTYSRVDSARTCFDRAKEACGLNLCVTGVLGFRTVHQADARAQLVLCADTKKQKGGAMNNSPLRECSNTFVADKMVMHSHEEHDNCDILRTPRLVENGNETGINQSIIHNGVTTKMILNAIQQAVILAECLVIKKNNPDDNIRGWQMAPFIEAVDAQQLSYFIIRYFCDILRIQWESTRSHTKERALMMFDKLVKGVYETSPRTSQRIHFAYGVHVPTIPALRKEYGELLVACGMIGEAITIFEDLHLWDNLIYCYCLLGKKAAAVDLIKVRLSETPNDPRLWCSLGDATNEDAYYEKALDVSNNRSTRAKRSLARSAYNRGDYEKSKILWDSAMTINSLYPDGWFALGAAALKARDIDKALDAFTRAVQLDPDNGEAWNNIGCLHKIKKRSKEAFIAFKEALKFRRTSWQLWENFSEVAMDVKNFSMALEATKMVLDLTNNKRIDAELLEKLMVEMEAKSSGVPLLSTAAVEDSTSQILPSDSSGDTVVVSGHSESEMATLRETDKLINLLGEVLQKIVRSGGDVWGLYARWHKFKGDLTMCSEALLKQVRSYQGSDLLHNHDRFKKFAHASLQLCRVYMEIALSTGSHRELTAAEMHLRNSIKQAVRFSDTEEFRDLQTCLDEVKERLEILSTKNAESRRDS